MMFVHAWCMRVHREKKISIDTVKTYYIAGTHQCRVPMPFVWWVSNEYFNCPIKIVNHTLQ